MKAFNEPILPGRAGLNETGAAMLVVQPLPDRGGRKLTAVIRTEELRMTLLWQGALQHRQHVSRANRRGDMNGPAFAGEFIPDAQGLEETTIGPRSYKMS